MSKLVLADMEIPEPRAITDTVSSIEQAFGPSGRGVMLVDDLKMTPRSRANAYCRRYKEHFIAKHGQLWCEECSCLTAAWYEVHHIIAVREGGSNDDSNLICLCFPCHKQKHGWDQ